jgi:hypothetical protein
MRRDDLMHQPGLSLFQVALAEGSSTARNIGHFANRNISESFKFDDAGCPGPTWQGNLKLQYNSLDVHNCTVNEPVVLPKSGGSSFFTG